MQGESYLVLLNGWKTVGCNLSRLGALSMTLSRVGAFAAAEAGTTLTIVEEATMELRAVWQFTGRWRVRAVDGWLS